MSGSDEDVKDEGEQLTSPDEESVEETPAAENEAENDEGAEESSNAGVIEDENEQAGQESEVTEESAKGSDIIVYDFAHPSHKLNSRLPVLEVLNAKIAANLSSLLSAQFHQHIAIKPKEPSFEKFEDYVKTLPECISISQYRMDPLQGSSLLILDGDLIFMLVDMYFGGVDELSESLGARTFTPTELRITERVRENVFKAISASWEPVIRINPVFQTLLTSVEITNPAHPSAVVVCCRFAIEMKSGTRECHLVIPYSVLEPIRPQLTNDLQSMRDQDYVWLQEFTQQVMGCEIDIEGELLAKESADTAVELSQGITAGYFLKLGLALLFVLGVFLAFAWLMRRMNHMSSDGSGLQIVGSLNIGTKERLLVVQVGGEQVLLGATQSNINKLHVLKETIPFGGSEAQQEGQFANMLKNLRGKGTSPS
ncbi:unnamed protein product [Cyprideis torosa]|uniref:Uncharacterized protein n=1 Tax=Cyprideis torosa TaxID=163714 RepID=A0A7R8VZQ2_9CRUS|nr:unnamed protein product [Cyprideis torosa]CAG0878810.1 unnamed protein product [Cyprideis torosa]